MPTPDNPRQEVQNRYICALPPQRAKRVLRRADSATGRMTVRLNVTSASISPALAHALQDRLPITPDRSGTGSACWKATVYRFVTTEAGVEHTFAAGQSG